MWLKISETAHLSSGKVTGGGRVTSIRGQHPSPALKPCPGQNREGAHREDRPKDASRGNIADLPHFAGSIRNLRKSRPGNEQKQISGGGNAVEQYGKLQ